MFIRNHKAVKPLTIATCVVSLFGVWTAAANAAVFTSDPNRYWPNGIVYYQFDPQLQRVGVCTPGGSTVAYCDTQNGDDDCTNGDTCEPLAGRCVPSTLPSWGSCRVDADCVGDAICNELSGQCLGEPLPAYTTCDQNNPTACNAGESCLPKGIANICITMQLWSQVANLSFVEVGCQGGTPLCPGNSCMAQVPDHYVRFFLTPSDPASNSTGMNPDGSQTVGVNPDGNFAWGFVHEVGHVLGMDHEMQRTDRKNFVDVYTSRVVEGKGDNYNEKDSDYFYPILAHGYAEPFDFDSIMMYPLCVYADANYQHDGDDNPILDDDSGEPIPRDDCNTNPPDPCCDPTVDNNLRPIDPIDAWATNWIGQEDQIGQRSHFSKMDALVMSFLYPQSSWRFVDSTSPFDTEDGTFLRPHKAFLDGVSDVPAGGTLFVQPGSYAAVDTLSNPMTIKAPIGPVHLGD